MIIGALALVLIGSAVVRLDRLSARPLGHTESYVPNIELPDDYGEPRARLTLSRTVVNSMWEPHPPGWYVMMWAWTKAAGTSLVAIRLPSVFFGVLCVLLVFTLGRLEGDAATALLAAALLGFNGHQVAWAQLARAPTVLCAEGLLSCVLLLLVARKGPRSYAWLYVLVSLVALGTEHYFWLVFAGQIVFCLLRARSNPGAWLPLIQFQLLVLIAGGPLLTLAVFQGGVPYLDADALATTGDMAGFGFLFERGIGQNTALLDVLRPALAIVGSGFFALGLLRSATRASTARIEDRPSTGPSFQLMLFATLVSCAAVLVAASVLGAAKPPKRAALMASAAMPLIMLAVAWLLNRYQDLLSALAARFARSGGRSRERPSLVVVMALVPFGLAALVSQVNPLLASRHLMALVPFLLLIIARGLMSIRGFGPRWLSGALLAACLAGLAGIHGMSLEYNIRGHQPPQDYRALADVWAPAVRPTDLILVRDHFRTTPIFYYMKPSAYPFVGLNHGEEVRRRAPQRIWVLLIGKQGVDPAIREALRGYERMSGVEARNISADLYVRPPPNKD